MRYQDIITIEPGKRGGLPCIRNMRIAVSDVLTWLAVGMSTEEILRDYPELTEDDIRACLAFTVEQGRRHQLTLEQIADVNRIRENLQSGKIRLVTDEELAAFWKKFEQ